ncbi:OLC1v1033342C1 [Oldenlandia corymbosa var. corymbosa]|uniref:Alkyl transferase n=1 Tax=Oldenlandia corymbosa var. corymbosa TaxID=529605 RepID=A0AAV1CN74_OLDCO|nr:OLC1v1033342C1 [Oldenlandia corymbosa var. corymbosa]
MGKRFKNQASQLVECLCSSLRKCVFSVLSVGPLPDHIAFIMDGNRRYAKKCNLLEGDGHKLGYSALMNMLKYCYELGVKFVTIYAFSIDNFKRRPEEVQSTMQLIQEKIEDLIKEESLVNQYGVRIYFLGNLKLLSKSVRLAAEKAMRATAGNSKAVLSICLAYTSTDEIVHAVQESCDEKRDKIRASKSCMAGNGTIAVRGNGKDGSKEIIAVHDVEKHMYASVAPDPDVIIRTSGETRLSNFLLWQSACCLLYAPSLIMCSVNGMLNGPRFHSFYCETDSMEVRTYYSALALRVLVISFAVVDQHGLW